MSKFKYANTDTHTHSLSLDAATGKMRVESRHKNDSMTTFYAWHGHELGFSMPGAADGQVVDGERFDEWLESDPTVRALVERITAGYEGVWDGSNHVARYSDDANEAQEELERYLESADAPMLADYGMGVGFWQAGDWIANASDSELGLSAEMSEDDLEKLAAELSEQAASDNVYVPEDDLLHTLRGRLERIREAAEA